MKSVKNIFLPLYERLASLKVMKGPKIDFDANDDYWEVIRKVKEDALNFQDGKEVIQEIIFILNEIQQIRNGTHDLSYTFYWPDLTRSEIRERLGNGNLIIKTIAPPELEDWQRKIINEHISEQLDAFENGLGFIKELLKPKSKQEIKSFEYRHFKGHSKNLEKLLLWLSDNGFISKNASAKDFIQCFSGEKPPDNRVEWVAKKNILRYLIVKLAENSLNTIDGRGKGVNLGDRIRSCFYSKEGLENVEGAKDPSPNITKQVDTIVRRFEKLSPGEKLL